MTRLFLGRCSTHVWSPQVVNPKVQLDELGVFITATYRNMGEVYFRSRNDSKLTLVWVTAHKAGGLECATQPADW